MSRIQLNFYCIQPIALKRKDLRHIVLTKTPMHQIENFIDKSAPLPAWVERMRRISSLYDSLFTIQPITPKTEILSEQLNAEFLVNGKSSLAPYLEPSSVDAYLIFDYRLFYFNIVYEMAFKFPVEDLPVFLSSDKTANIKTDLYNTIRNLMVKETDKSTISHWAEKIKSSVTATILEIIATRYNYRCEPSSVRILNNTGNITNVVIPEDNSADQNNKLAWDFVRLNDSAERLRNYSEPLVLDNSRLVYHFNGRFHTIFLQEPLDRYRYIPIQFHIQFMWFYLKRINEMMENLNNQVIGDDSLKNVEFQNRLIDVLIHKVEILSLHNANFKTAIEIDNDRIYKKIESRWTVEQLLENSNQYIAFFKDYLQRIYIRKTSRIEQRQNIILAFISVLQLIALISVWNDYLSLLNEDNITGVRSVIPLFKWIDLRYLLYFNLLSPILMIVIIIGLLFYFNKK